MMPRTRTGAEIVAAQPERLSGARIGLLTNFTGTMPDLSRSVDALARAGVPLVHLFGPEHGLSGAVQAGESTNDDHDPGTGLPLSDTYLADDDRLDEIVSSSGVDALVFDMQDIGVRFYTYVWTMYDAMRTAARLGIRFTVLDRPNPLGGAVVSGPGITDPAYASFVGRVDVPQRHGLTAGELARLFVARDLAAEGLELELDVVSMEGWDPARDFAATGLPWVPPSPNMPTLDTAFAFAGTGLFEGTTLSEGRGTTLPFQLLGAPFLDERFAASARERDLPGVLVRDAWFQPTFHKYAGETVRGVQLHLVERYAFDPVATAVALLEIAHETAPEQTSSLGAGERIDPGDSGFALDRLWGSPELRRALDGSASFEALGLRTRPTVDHYAEGVLIYER
ncbi:DUF1343 domain-containing protein [Microbacterium resistens]|uniref:exo-beta-N-acetylmuramidase NamZ family protein n=1 Tax=Microbacterium resistens TaxID=156977 RepID=UPI001C5707AF|nr:DUF1343 domain-containing protein [Microbacterium resistens]MBW1640882.1 DUF1343 domain-containing protein [Microbacterium resistens]